MTGAHEPDGLPRAVALIELRRYEDAARLLADVIATTPGTAHPRCLLAQCQLELGDASGALDTASHALGLQPDSEHAHRLRSIALVQLKRPREAVEAAERAVACAPTSLWGYSVLCTAALADHDTARAAIVASRAVELDPTSPSGHNALGHVALARKQPAEAERHFRTALSIAPNHPESLNNLGVALIRQGRRKQAVHYFGEAAKLDPRSSLARENAVVAARSSVIGATVFLIVFLVYTVYIARSYLGFVGASVIVVGVAVHRLWPIIVRNPEAGDPRANRELLRSLRREGAPVTSRTVWVFRAFGIVILSLTAVLLTAGGVTDLVDGGPMSGLVSVLLALCGLWLVVELVRLRRAPEPER